MTLKDQLAALNQEAFMSGWEMGRATKYWDPDKNTEVREKYTVNSGLYLKTAKLLEQAILAHVETPLEQEDKDTLSILRGMCLQLLMAKETGISLDGDRPEELTHILKEGVNYLQDVQIRTVCYALLLLGTYYEHDQVTNLFASSLRQVLNSLEILPPNKKTDH